VLQLRGSSHVDWKSDHLCDISTKSKVTPPDGRSITHVPIIKATNNMVEYEVLIFGLSATLSLGIRQLLVKADS
jgi:ribonuclease HI